MTKKELRITITEDLKKQIGHQCVEKGMRTNIFCEILLHYALDHIDEITFFKK